MSSTAFPAAKLLLQDEIQLSELDLNRLGLAHAALRKLLEKRGLTVLQSDPELMLWRRSGDGEVVTLTPLFWHHEYSERAASMRPGLYVFTGTWVVSAPSTDFKGSETAEITANVHGNPKVAAGDMIAELAIATYAGRPLRYRSNR